MEENINTRTLMDMLRELAENQFTIAKCDFNLFQLRTRQQIDGCVKDAQARITGMANEYGVEIDRITTQYEGEKASVNKILENYKNAMVKVAEPFNEEIKNVEQMQSGAQVEFISLVANFMPTIMQSQGQIMRMNKKTKEKTANVLKAIKEGRYEQAIDGLTEVQQIKEDNQPEAVKTVVKSILEQMKAKLQIIQQCREEKEEIEVRKATAIEAVNAEKNMALTNVRKQTRLQKIIGSIFSKLNGTKKFMKNAIDPLKIKINEIKGTYIPSVMTNAQNRMENFSKIVIDKMNELDNEIVQKVDQYAEILAEKKESVGNNISWTKEKILNGLKDAQETAQIEAMIAGDFIKDKVETVQIHGIEAIDNIGDKIETAQILGMIAKDNIKARKNAIIQGAVAIKNSATEKVNNVRESAIQVTKKAKDSVVQIATNLKNGATNKIASTKDMLIKGATSIKDVGKYTYKSLISMGLQTKMNIISGIQSKLDEQQKAIQEKMEQINLDINDPEK